MKNRVLKKELSFALTPEQLKQARANTNYRSWVGAMRGLHSSLPAVGTVSGKEALQTAAKAMIKLDACSMSVFSKDIAKPWEDLMQRTEGDPDARRDGILGIVIHELGNFRVFEGYEGLMHFAGAHGAYDPEAFAVLAEYPAKWSLNDINSKAIASYLAVFPPGDRLDAVYTQLEDAALTRISRIPCLHGNPIEQRNRTRSSIIQLIIGVAGQVERIDLDKAARVSPQMFNPALADYAARAGWDELFLKSVAGAKEKGLWDGTAKQAALESALVGGYQALFPLLETEGVTPTAAQVQALSTMKPAGKQLTVGEPERRAALAVWLAQRKLGEPPVVEQECVIELDLV